MHHRLHVNYMYLCTQTVFGLTPIIISYSKQRLHLKQNNDLKTERFDFLLYFDS